MWASLLFSIIKGEVSLEQKKLTAGFQWCNHLFADGKWFNYSRNPYLCWYSAVNKQTNKNPLMWFRMLPNRTLFKQGPSQHVIIHMIWTLNYVTFALQVPNFIEGDGTGTNKREWGVRVIWREKYSLHFEIQKATNR